jgi:hypothetical protein
MYGNRRIYKGGYRLDFYAFSFMRVIIVSDLYLYITINAKI